MTYVLLFFILCSMFIVMMSIPFAVEDKYKRAIKKLNKNSKSLLETTNFELTKDIPLKFTKTVIQHFYVDMKHQQICIFDYPNKTLCVVKFNELISFQIIKNNKVIVDSNTNLSLTNLYSEDKEETCSDLRLLLHITKDGIEHTITYYFIINLLQESFFKLKIQESSDRFLSFVDSLNEFTYFFGSLLSFKSNSDKNIL